MEEKDYTIVKLTPAQAALTPHPDCPYELRLNLERIGLFSTILAAETSKSLFINRDHIIQDYDRLIQSLALMYRKTVPEVNTMIAFYLESKGY